jgi:hypothetical protein
VNQLAMNKSFAVNNLRFAGYSERRIAQTLHVSRGAVRRHLRASASNSTKAPTGSGDAAPTGYGDSNDTKALTGSTDDMGASEAVAVSVSSSSQCAPFRELIIAKCELGLSAKRIHQDLVADHG